MTSSFPPLGQGVVNTPIVTPDEILASVSGAEKLPGGVIVGVGARTREVRIGEILARLTADVTDVGNSGHFIPRKSTEAAASVATGQADVTVDDAHMFVVGDTILVDDGVSAMTVEIISAINYVTNVITVSTNFDGGTNPSPIGSRVSVTASGQNNSNGIAGERYTPNSALGSVTGRASMYTAGLFKLPKLKGSGRTTAAGLDGAARAAFAAPIANDVTAPEGLLVRVRLGDPTAT